jgi:hypothetical protein
MEAVKVIDSVFKYLEANMVPGMNDLQEIAFYSVREAVFDEAEALIEKVNKNPLLRAVLTIDKDGNVDPEKLANRIKKGIERKGSVTFDIPMYGPVRFVADDIDNILGTIMEVGHNENYQRTF